MPRALQRAVDAVLDGLLPDIKHESYRVLDEHLTFLQAYELRPHGADDTLITSPLSPRHSSTRSPRPFGSCSAACGRRRCTRVAT